jgi:hypothetical protein
MARFLLGIVLLPEGLLAQTDAARPRAKRQALTS